MLVPISLCLCCASLSTALSTSAPLSAQHHSLGRAPETSGSSETLEQLVLPVLAKRVCNLLASRAKFSCASWVLHLRFYCWQRLRRGSVGCGQRALGLLWASTLLPGSCGHREPSPRPEAIPPPLIPMVEMPWEGLRDEKVVLSNENCSSLVYGNTQRGKAVGHRYGTGGRDPDGM